MIVIVLTGAVGFLLVRMLKRDFARYDRMESFDDLVRYYLFHKFSISRLFSRFTLVIFYPNNRIVILAMNMDGSKFTVTYSVHHRDYCCFLHWLELVIN